MNSFLPTLAIYSIQDCEPVDTPNMVHDHAITLMDKGKVIKHLTLERISRKKHDNSLHTNLFDILKKERLLNSSDFDLVFPDNVVGRSVITKCGRIRYEAPLNFSLSSVLEKGKCRWLNNYPKAYSLNHELSHIAANLPFYGNFKENSLLIHFDGGASLSNFSAWLFKENKFHNIEYGWRFKYLSSFFNANALVFAIIGAKFNEQNSVPGKMMGLASFGNYSSDMEEWLKENNYFTDCWGSKSVFFKAALKKYGWKNNKFDTKDKFLQDILATFQHIFTRDFMQKLAVLQNKIKADYLYYSGGSALNIVTNKKIIDNKLFNDVFIPPCPDDSGLSLGAAAFIEFMKHGNVKKHSPYMINWGLNSKNTILEHINKIALEISKGKVIGICNGDAEIGPRALGNRSIIARADNVELAKKVSMFHKRREWYRPVAPIMLCENAKYFTDKSNIHHLANFMLLDFDINKSGTSEICGATHVNGTARIQVIRTEEQNPFMYNLLSVLNDKYNIKALINTSFNVRGEPIVHSKTDAVNSAKNMSLDAVVVNGELILLD